MLRKILTSLVALVLVGAALIVITSYFWVQNPYGLEQERRAPKGEETLPLVTIVPNSKNHLLYKNYENNPYAIHLALPNHYIHESNYSKGISKSYGASVTIYYPNMNGKYHKENEQLTECNGYCNGYMRASIEPNSKSAIELNKRKILRHSEERKKDSHLRYYENLEQEFGLSTHFQIRYPVLEEKSKGKKNSTNEYFVKYDKDGSPKYFFECHPFTPSPACSVYFNLSSMPELLIKIRFSRSLMNDWENVILLVDDKISDWKLEKIILNNK